MGAMNKDIAGIREEYKMGRLDEADLAADPITQFQSWFDEALGKHVMEPNAMTLATVSSTGKPSLRIVLLKHIDQRGLGFYTNYESRKGVELSENPRAALLFFWPELQRQVRVEGVVEKTTAQQSDAYFQSRPKGSKLGAVASPQSSEIVDRAELDRRLATLEDTYKNTDSVPRPAHWGGYLLIPERFEFWQGGGNRLHDRLVYKKVDNHWNVVRLAP